MCCAQSAQTTRGTFQHRRIGRFTTEEEIDTTIELLVKHVDRLRSMSPLWEMVQEGIDLKSIEWTQDSSTITTKSPQLYICFPYFTYTDRYHY